MTTTITKTIVKTYMTSVDNMEDCFDLAIETLDDLFNVKVLLYAKNSNSGKFSSVFDLVDEPYYIYDNDNDKIAFNIKVDLNGLSVYSDGNTDQLNDYDATCKKIVDSLVLNRIEARGSSQSEWDNYYFVTTRVLIPEELGAIKTLEYTMTVRELVISLVNINHCVCCDTNDEEVIDSITTTLYEGYASDDEIKSIAIDNLNCDKVDWEASTLITDYVD